MQNWSGHQLLIVQYNRDVLPDRIHHNRNKPKISSIFSGCAVSLLGYRPQLYIYLVGGLHKDSQVAESLKASGLIVQRNQSAANHCHFYNPSRRPDSGDLHLLEDQQRLLLDEWWLGQRSFELPSCRRTGLWA